MDRYTRVEKPREETPIKENEIRIMTQGRMRNYITYAINLLQVTNFRLFQIKKIWVFLLFHLLEIICLSCIFCHHLIYDDFAWTIFCKRHMCKFYYVSKYSFVI